ncbi:MAG: ferredoxin [Myxococcota bacterium]|nr:ferredoxin [Myxococcota bacterium]
MRYRRRAAQARSVAHGARAAEDAAGAGAFRIRVDLDLCQGHGVCVGECPDVFDIERTENKVELKTESPDPGLRERVELAVRHCPTNALAIEE